VRYAWWILAALAALAALLLPACAWQSTSLRLEELNKPALPEAEVGADVAAVRVRAEALWKKFEAAKLTTYLTKDRITEFFENDKDRTDFIAIYASLFRTKKFQREFVHKVAIGKIIVEQNGVIARVETTIWGKIYFVWDHKIHETEMWKKVDGVWMMKPESY
jgi:hypothetical protein